MEEEREWTTPEDIAKILNDALDEVKVSGMTQEEIEKKNKEMDELYSCL